MPSKRIIVEKHPRRTDRYHVALHCKAACEDLLRYGSFGTRKWNVPEAVRTAPPDVKASYLKGFFDSEGGVSVRGYVIYATSVCAHGLHGVSMLLADFGIPTRIKQPLGKNFCLLKIQRRQSISLFAGYVGFTIKRKKKALQRLLSGYKFFMTPPAEVLKLEPEMQRLRDLGLTYREIAEKTNLGYRTVWRHLNKATF
jgi:translation initiation factor 5B